MISIDAHCSGCGYDKLLMIGGLRENFHKFNALPVFCQACNEISTANYKASPLVCEDCSSQNVTRLDTPENWKVSADYFRKFAMRSADDGPALREGQYRCPKCGEFEVRFGTGWMKHGMMSGS